MTSIDAVLHQVQNGWPNKLWMPTFHLPLNHQTTLPIIAVASHQSFAQIARTQGKNTPKQQSYEIKVNLSSHYNVPLRHWRRGTIPKRELRGTIRSIALLSFFASRKHHSAGLGCSRPENYLQAPTEHYRVSCEHA
jgi:hypothetical protein